MAIFQRKCANNDSHLSLYQDFWAHKFVKDFVCQKYSANKDTVSHRIHV